MKMSMVDFPPTMVVTHIFSCERDRNRTDKGMSEEHVKGYFTMSL